MKKLNLPITLSACLVAGCLFTAYAQVETSKGSGKLRYVESVTRNDLESVNDLRISADGKFLYATPWSLGAIAVFQRDISSGKLTHIETLSDPSNLTGNVGIELCPDEDYVIAAAFRAHSAVLFKRDKQTGKLTFSDVARQGEKDVDGLGFAVDAAFSLDAKYVYVTDGEEGGITTFAVRDGKLTWKEKYQGEDNCLAGTRGITMHPDGKTILVVNYHAGTLVVLDRDPETGHAKVRQVVKDEEDNVHGLAGAFGVACSRDGRFVYVTSGRFTGDSSISVFRFNNDRKIEVLQEFIAGRDELGKFLGGNRLVLSPDGRNLYAVGTRSNSVACFERDSKTGLLKFMETLVGTESKTFLGLIKVPVVSASGTNNGLLGGAAGIDISPDGLFVYIAAENEKCISIYRRE